VVLYYFFPSIILYWVHTISIITTISWLIIWSISAVSGKIIYNKEMRKYNNINEDRAEVILLFIPWYNIYQRYKEHSFDNPNIRLKESIIRWILWTTITLATQSPIISICILLVIVSRVSMIAGWINIMSNEIKKDINHTFKTNPEELWSYIIATIDLISQKIQNKMIQPTRQELVQWYKKNYSYILPIEKTIIIQYCIGTIWIVLLAILQKNSTNRTRTLPILLIISRYVIMYSKWKHLPPLPLAREIHIFMENMYEKITRK
jgi:hypothetical protein